MENKLTPKPTFVSRKNGWKELDDLLLANFTSSSKSTPGLVINPSEFSMSVEEIISEAKSRGYEVEQSGSKLQYLEFK